MSLRIDLSHRVVLDQLVAEGWVAAPDLLPRYCSLPDFDDRLARCRDTPVADLFQKEPAQ